jgi:hypothetical protein
MPYDLTETDERLLATELAEDLSDYVSNELADQLYEMAADILRQRGIDPGTDYGRDLIQELSNRIRITTR